MLRGVFKRGDRAEFNQVLMYKLRMAALCVMGMSFKVGELLDDIVAFRRTPRRILLLETLVKKCVFGAVHAEGEAQFCDVYGLDDIDRHLPLPAHLSGKNKLGRCFATHHNQPFF